MIQDLYRAICRKGNLRIQLQVSCSGDSRIAVFPRARRSPDRQMLMPLGMSHTCTSNFSNLTSQFRCRPSRARVSWGGNIPEVQAAPSPRAKPCLASGLDAGTPDLLRNRFHELYQPMSMGSGTLNPVTCFPDTQLCFPVQVAFSLERKPGRLQPVT
jgi:hypothetical protein